EHERDEREAQRRRDAPAFHFGRPSIHAAMRSRSASVMSVSLPSGIARVTTTCVMILAALAAICGSVSSSTPAGGRANAGWTGSAAWHMTQWVFIKARISASVGGPDWAEAVEVAESRKTAAAWQSM